LNSNEKESFLVFFVLIFKKNFALSHIPQRTEKDCLNCGTIVQGKYCQNCGQENVLPHESFGHMVKHFLYDITHFDSKFFDSMKYLLLKPGFLPQEYMKGRRVAYLNPIKKYVFTSAVFFLLFFSFFLKGSVNIDLAANNPMPLQQRIAKIAKYEKELLKNPKNEKLRKAILLLKDTVNVITENDLFKYWDDYQFINVTDREYKTQREYDSVQKALPASEKDGWFVRMLERKNQQMRVKFKDNPSSAGKSFLDSFLHKLPYMLFVSLPIFALFLKLLYIRRKKYYYADHGIFSIYHYIFTFILLLITFTFDKLNKLTKWEFFDLLTVLLVLSGGVYLYLSMKRFYGQGHGKTFLKFLLLNIAGLAMLIILFMIFLLFSVFEI
jgi:hypothetical protein